MSEITEYLTVKNDTITFLVLDSDVELFESETAYGVKTCAIVHGLVFQNEVYYLEDEPVTLETAINLWQDINNRLLTQEEFDQVVVENNLIEE